MANAVDLCLASDVAGDLNVDPSDAAVARVVTAASRVIAGFCGRKFEKWSGTEYPASYRRDLLIVDRAPIISIDSITELGTTVDSSIYEFPGDLAEAGMVHRLQGHWLRTAELGGFVTETVEHWTGRTDRLAVTYTAGWVTPGQNALDPGTYPSVTLPEDVQEAVIQTAVQLYRTRGVDGAIAAESLGDWSVTYRADGPQNPIPRTAQALLEPYKRRRVS